MKVIFLALFTSSLISSCDSPQRTRTPYAPVATTAVTTEGDSATGTDSTTGTDTTDTTDTATQTTGFETCNINLQYSKTSIGNFGICQNTLDETKFKVKFEMSDTSEGTCFVPVRRNTDGSSFKLGIAECVNNEANREYTMTLTKERSEKINGVIVMKARALSPYMQCMNAVRDFNNYSTNLLDGTCYMNSYNNPNYYAQCVCNKFVTNYKNYYNDNPSFPLNN
jgi:hypothetical protein